MRCRGARRSTLRHPPRPHNRVRYGARTARTARKHAQRGSMSDIATPNRAGIDVDWDVCAPPVWPHWGAKSDGVDTDTKVDLRPCNLWSHSGHNTRPDLWTQLSIGTAVPRWHRGRCCFVAPCCVQHFRLFMCKTWMAFKLLQFANRPQS